MSRWNGSKEVRKFFLFIMTSTLKTLSTLLLLAATVCQSWTIKPLNTVYRAPFNGPLSISFSASTESRGFGIYRRSSGIPSGIYRKLYLYSSKDGFGCDEDSYQMTLESTLKSFDVVLNLRSIDSSRSPSLISKGESTMTKFWTHAMWIRHQNASRYFRRKLGCCL